MMEKLPDMGGHGVRNAHRGDRAHLLHDRLQTQVFGGAHGRWALSLYGGVLGPLGRDAVPRMDRKEVFLCRMRCGVSDER
jgi:hypothetical protein